MKRGMIQALLAVVLTLVGRVDEALAGPPNEQHTLIVVDGSGSMAAVRTDGTTRFQEAIRRAKQLVSAPMGINRYFSIWMFHGSTYTSVQAFQDPATTLNTLNQMTLPGGSTPLAHAVCDAVDVLLAYKKGDPAVVATKVLHLVSDGEENSTPSSAQCYGPPSATDFPNLTPNSWEWKVRNKLRTGKPDGSGAGGLPVVLDVTVLNGYVSFAGTGSSVPEFSEKGELVASRSVANMANFFSFLQGLSAETGGSYTTIVDSRPAPVFGDTNQDYCVDATDYNLVLNNYGFTVPPANPAADLNLDNVVDYYDYMLVVNNQGQGSGCGTTSSFVK
ncbi:hypothetical protein D187_002636 [Cystobacter fuscus DSM 2262]|uniref:VWFA domain-containing protein n=1 Tax=Cystobacter fuscus (strain ATCC 25194 / DSM 2262 / NBRC 100088 / M29) TaxID=1242864 RepID=S9PC78_CYSF2|nr:VWA domain-containing protein [Cystobacter fuscus]EPX59892.1 hypothetical protein D187_002636 [Cystobacter fuscus DSM 2262]